MRRVSGYNLFVREFDEAAIRAMKDELGGPEQTEWVRPLVLLALRLQIDKLEACLALRNPHLTGRGNRLISAVLLDLFRPSVADK